MKKCCPRNTRRHSNKAVCSLPRFRGLCALAATLLLNLQPARRYSAAAKNLRKTRRIWPIAVRIFLEKVWITDEE